MNKLVSLEDKKPIEIARDFTTIISLKKTEMPILSIAILAILAGSYIALGGLLSLAVTFDLSPISGIGFKKLISGASFSVGLILVLISGAELFTGNNLIILGVLSKNISKIKLLKNWTIVYVFNFLGSIAIVIIFYLSGLWKTGNNSLGISVIEIACNKINLNFIEAFSRAIGCNWMVCLAVWMSIGSKNIAGKVLVIFFPIMGFVAIGFEHCIANMYFIPSGIMLKNLPEITQYGINLDILTWENFFIKNLIPVTLGNIVGGTFFVGTSYWYAYIKPEKI